MRNVGCEKIGEERLSEGPAFASYGAAAFARAKAEIRKVLSPPGRSVRHLSVLASTGHQKPHPHERALQFSWFVVAP